MVLYVLGEAHELALRGAVIKQEYDDVQSDGRYEEGMARMV